MKPNVIIDSAKTPDGSEMLLYQHDQDYCIKVNGKELMHSRQHESEIELARLGCAHLAKRKSPRILIGGLGMGFTLREALNIVNSNASIVVSELMSKVIEWNRDFFGDMTEHPQKDKRVDVRRSDVTQVLSHSHGRFDSIILDVDNGPSAMTYSRNGCLYRREGIRICRQALRNKGCLAVWSMEPSKKFERLLMRGGFHVRRYRAAPYKGSKSQNRYIWVASENQDALPPGGGEPLPLKS